METAIVGTSGAATGFAFFSGVVRGDAVASFKPFLWFARDSETRFCGAVLVGCCPPALDDELRGGEVMGAGSGSGEGVCTGFSAEVLADGFGSGAGDCTAVVRGR